MAVMHFRKNILYTPFLQWFITTLSEGFIDANINKEQIK